ncbi:MAG TPA: hypothetical protein VGY53_08105 [Isosphaeraceae bacterium]|nr:hypothetical protein [Isosphaeraceae bacterium]
MQGTIVMMMALSGLGCHHKQCCADYAPACYSVSYAACYSGGYVTGGCYGGCYGMAVQASAQASAQVMPTACYAMGYGCYPSASYSVIGSCYGGCYSPPPCRPKCGGLFSCFHKRRCDVFSAGGYGYPLPVYGSYTAVYGPGMTAPQTTTGQGAMPGMAPSGGAAPSMPPPATDAGTPPPAGATPPANPTPAAPPAPPDAATPVPSTPAPATPAPPPPPGDTAPKAA